MRQTQPILTDMPRWAAAAILLIFGAAGPASAGNITDFTISTVPAGGSVTAMAGGVNGWGYSITNEDSYEWLSITAVGSTASLQDGTLDSSVFDFPVINPGQTVTVPWMENASGLFQLTWDSNAPQGYSQSGLFTVDAEWYTENPADPNCDFNDSPNSSCFDPNPLQNSAVTPFQASVATPEPGVGMLLILGSCGLLALAIRRRIIRSSALPRLGN